MQALARSYGDASEGSKGGLPRLAEMCIDVACQSKESVQAWRRQIRTLERLPSHLAHPLFHRLLRSGLLNPPLLENFQYCMEEIIVSGDGSINAEWTAYFKSFKYLRVLKAANCRSLSNFALSHLKGLADTLQELDISCCRKITDEGLSHVLVLTSLKNLQLSETRITTEGIEKLSILKGLMSLDLGGLPVTDSTLCALTALTGLQNLDIWGSRVSDKGVLYLQNFSSLKNVNLAWTEVTRVPPLQSLKHLNISKCTVASIFEGWEGLDGHLEVLDLSGTNILGPLEILTGVGASNVLMVDLSSSNFKDFEVLTGLRKIERLDLGETVIDDATMDTIRSIGPNLRHLDLSGCRVTSGGVGVLAGYVPRLQRLVLSGTLVDDLVFPFLQLMPSLKMIDLSFTNVKGCLMEEKSRALEMLSFTAMKDLSSLRMLNLRNTSMSDGSCLGLLCLSELTHLDLRSELLSDSSLHSLSVLKKLVALSFEGAMLTDSGLLHFTPPPQLNSLSLLDCWLLTKRAVLQFSEAHKDVSLRHGFILMNLSASKSSPLKQAQPKGSPYLEGTSSDGIHSFSGSNAQSMKGSLVVYSDERIRFSRAALLEIREQSMFGDVALPPLLSTMEELAGLFKPRGM